MNASQHNKMPFYCDNPYNIKGKFDIKICSLLQYYGSITCLKRIIPTDSKKLI